ncbi:MAG TPA: hypothetical protein VMS56_00695 [Thermoanaerobaculia bacterium]|nr:hypothetical protein [Thermoanaerobaculia bacterium]
MAPALLFIFYCIEAGVFFTIVPWTHFWNVNSVLHSTAFSSVVADNLFFRGFVSGFGIVHLLIGLKELAMLFRRPEEGSR